MLERNVASVDLSRAPSRAPGTSTRARSCAPWPTAPWMAAGHALEDDATVLCLDWHGTHDQEGSVVSGADPGAPASRSSDDHLARADARTVSANGN